MGPEFLSCGHINWYTGKEITKAKDKGFCCPGGEGRLQRDWSHCTTAPVPMRLRRTSKSEGLCTDTVTGIYCGGDRNDCRSQTDLAKWCDFHQPLEIKQKAVVDSVDALFDALGG